MRSSAKKTWCSALCFFLCAASAGATPYGEAAGKIAAELGRNSKVAVLPFLYIGEEKSRGGQVVSERLTTELAGDKNIKLLERSLLDKVLGELKLQGGGLAEVDEARKAGKLLAADYVVIGSLFLIKDGELGLNVRAVETETGKIKSAAYVQVNEDWMENIPAFPGGIMPKNSIFKDCWEAWRALDRQDAGKAAEYFGKAIAADVTGACGMEHPGAAYFGRGLAYDIKGEFARAVGDFSVSIKAVPDDYLAYWHRAHLYRDLRQNGKSLADYDVMTRLGPGYPTGFYGRGLTLSRMGRKEEALKDLTKAIALNARMVTAYCARSRVLADLGRDEEAWADLDKAQKLSPDLPEIHFNKGEMFKRKRELDKALKEFEDLVELQPWSSAAYCSRGSMLGALHRFDAALADFNKAIELDPANPEAYFYRGVLFRTRMRNKEALANLDRAVELDNGDVRIYLERALLYGDLGRPAEGAADMGKVIELEQPLELSRYFSRGVLLARQGKDELALADLDKYIGLVPDRPEAYEVRGELRKKMGQDAKAQADFKKYEELNSKPDAKPDKRSAK